MKRRWWTAPIIFVIYLRIIVPMAKPVMYGGGIHLVNALG